VPVAPVITVRPNGALGVSGTVKPLQHFDVELQRKEGDTWTSQAFTDAAGAFTATVPVPGVYRARVAPSAGFAEGFSGEIELR
jgi:hypothetical protein